MTRKRRTPSSTNVYHVVSRGVGLQNIFMDDDDRIRMYNLMREKLPQHEGKTYAWCFMTNHVHLILNMEIEGMSLFMQRLLAGYSRSFNKRHGRCGHLFQERFYSEPIEVESYLLSAVRYVHQNPWRAHICTPDMYRWSSYSEYTNSPIITTTEPVLSAFGSTEAFIQYHHELPDHEQWIDYNTGQSLSDEVIRERIERELGQGILRTVVSEPPDTRAQIICKMIILGASQRQIQRLTGLGRTLISRDAQKGSKEPKQNSRVYDAIRP